ncbi:MAG: Dabb family protein [Thermodesulfobacteriota bacterium]|jgi:DTW domain-containing protein YfiP|nr:Dabb family protein [Desulfovibrio sp.]
MLTHIVMWRLKERTEHGTRAENAAKIKEILEALPPVIPQVKRLEVSSRVIESVPETHVALYSQFADEADLAAYAAHPRHQECVAFIKAVAEERRVVDFVTD